MDNRNYAEQGLTSLSALADFAIGVFFCKSILLLCDQRRSLKTVFDLSETAPSFVKSYRAYS